MKGLNWQYLASLYTNFTFGAQKSPHQVRQLIFLFILCSLEYSPGMFWVITVEEKNSLIWVYTWKMMLNKGIIWYMHYISCCLPPGIRTVTCSSLGLWSLSYKCQHSCVMTEFRTETGLCSILCYELQHVLPAYICEKGESDNGVPCLKTEA